jgi:outer membrane autotransporter protein
MKKPMNKRMLLGCLLAAMLPLPVRAAALLSPGEYNGEGVLYVSSDQTVIDTSGTYDIKNSDQTLHVQNTGETLRLFSLTGGKNVTVNGSVDVSGEGLLNGGTGIVNSAVTINGDLVYDVDNTDISTVSGTLLSVSGTGDTSLTVTGDLTMKNTMEKAAGSMSLITVNGQNTSLTVDGDLYLYNRMTEEVTGETSGANVLYANYGAAITVNGEKTELYGISSNPDAITAKRESTITLNSTQNKVVGNISFIEATGRFGLANGGTVTAVFDGADSYWWGDEQNYVPFWSQGFIGRLTGLTQLGTLDFTFKNGAEWFYFGDDCYYLFRGFNAPVARAKYISAITLEDGGIVNLQDEDIQQKLASVEGLTEVYPKLKEIKHDFVTIGDLKGSGGIFKMDLNVTDKSASDMLYVESSSDPGSHVISAPLTEEALTSLSDTNTLRFATTAQAASGVSFSYDTPSYSDSLYDYQALVGTETYEADDPENSIYNSKVGGSGNPGDTESFSWFQSMIPELDETFANGTNWFLYGFRRSVKPVVPRLLHTAAGAYDFALDMDRLNKRQGQAQYLDGEKDGLWVRMQRTSTERDGLTDGHYTMGQIGYDRLLDSGHHRLGLAYGYKKGSYTLNDHYGSGENRRREVLLYDTIVLDDAGSYVDLTARYGTLNHDFRAYGNDGQRISGEYDSHMTAVGAEFGRPFRFVKGAFFEPQAQIQYAWLGDADYRTENGYTGRLDSTTSLIGRLGFRIGQENEDCRYYLKADVLHEWKGGQTASLSDRLKHRIAYDVENRGTWYDMGVGTICRLGRNADLNIDVERSFGSRVHGWELNAGVSVRF